MNATRPRPRVYFFRDGIELTCHFANGLPLMGFGCFTGKVGNVLCFDSVVVRTTRDQDLTETHFDGKPVMVKVWSPETKAAWFAVASVSTVDRVNAQQLEKSGK